MVELIAESFLKETFGEALGWLRAGANGAMGEAAYLSSGTAYGEDGLVRLGQLSSLG